PARRAPRRRPPPGAPRRGPAPPGARSGRPARAASRPHRPDARGAREHLARLADDLARGERRELAAPVHARPRDEALSGLPGPQEVGGQRLRGAPLPLLQRRHDGRAQGEVQEPSGDAAVDPAAHVGVPLRRGEPHLDALVRDPELLDAQEVGVRFDGVEGFHEGARGRRDKSPWAGPRLLAPPSRLADAALGLAQPRGGGAQRGLAGLALLPRAGATQALPGGVVLGLGGRHLLGAWIVGPRACHAATLDGGPSCACWTGRSVTLDVGGGGAWPRAAAQGGERPPRRTSRRARPASCNASLARASTSKAAGFSSSAALATRAAASS